MAFDGNGNYNPPAPEYPLQPQTVISSADMNTLIQDIANALGNCMTRDSQGSPSVDLNLFTKKVINLGAAVNPNDAMRKVDVETYAITATTDRDMAGFRLKNLPATPTAGTDAVSANYVNTAQVDRTMNGKHLLGAPAGPYASTEYIPKQYVDDQDALKASLAGATYTGDQDFTGATTRVATQGSSDSSTKAASTAFVQAISMNTALPGLAGNALKTLRVRADEATAEWALGLPLAATHEGKTLALDGSDVPQWVNPPKAWANWVLITTNGGTLTVPDATNEIRAYVFGKGGNGANAGAGGGGGGCAWGTIPCKPGEVFTFDNTSSQATLKKGTTVYLQTNDGTNAVTTTGGTGGAGGTVGSGLGITSSGTAAGGAGGGNANGAGGASGSPLGTGGAGYGPGVGGGGGWGGAGSNTGGGGVGMAGTYAHYTLAGTLTDASGFSQSRDWSNAYTDPLLRPCNWSSVTPGNSLLAAAAAYSGLSGGAGIGGGRANTAGHGGSGGLGGGGGHCLASGYTGGKGGFGGGGGSGGTTSATGGAGGIGGGGAGGSTGGTGGSSAVIIFW